MNLGAGGIILIVLGAVLGFGPKKLPELGRAAGNTLREFKSATRGLADDDDETKKSEKTGAEK